MLRASGYLHAHPQATAVGGEIRAGVEGRSVTSRDPMGGALPFFLTHDHLHGSDSPTWCGALTQVGAASMTTLRCSMCGCPTGTESRSAGEICSALPQTACLMLTAYGDDQALLGAIMAGAVGYISKRTCGTDVVSAVRAVASGQSVLDPFASRLVMARLHERAASSDPVAALSDQGRSVQLRGSGCPGTGPAL